MIKRNKTTHIIIHTAAAAHGNEAIDQSAENIRNYHTNELRWEDIGYHYVIRFDGTIEEGRDGRMKGAHCTDMNMNERSIGICCSGHGDIKPFTQAQLRSLRILIDGIRKQYNIPISNVLGHRETGANKTCPGILVSMSEIRGSLIQGNISFDQDINLKDVEVPDSDGKDDFTEGITYEEALETAKGAKYDTLEEFHQARQKVSFWDKAALTLKGETKLGRITGTGLDIAELFLPGWAVKARHTLQGQQNNSIMTPSQNKDNAFTDILKRVFTQANGGFVRLWDELKGRDLRYYGAFALRIALILGAGWVADYLGLPLNELIGILFGQ